VLLAARYYTKARIWDESRVVRDWRGRFARKPSSLLRAPLRLSRSTPTRVAASRTSPAPARSSVTPSLSADLRARIERARASLPTTRAGWVGDAWVRPQERAVDRKVAEAEVALDRARQHLAAIESWLDGDPVPVQHAEQFRQGLLQLGRDSVVAEYRERVRAAEKALAEARAAAERAGPDEDMLPAIPAGTQTALRTDPFGQRVPSPELERHLDTVLEVGQAILDEAEAYLRRHQRYRELARRLTVGDLSPEAIAFLPAGSRERARAVLERSEAGREVRTLEAETVRALLAQVRPFGGATHARVYPSAARTGGARSDWRERLTAAEQYYPTSWIERSSQMRLTIASSARAYHLDRGTSAVLAMPREGGADDRMPYAGAFRDHTEQVVVHELGHQMESVIPGLMELQFAWLRRRTTHRGVVEPVVSMTEARPGISGQENEYTFRDQLADAYTGRTYEPTTTVDGVLFTVARHGFEHSEVFTTGMEETFGRKSRFDPKGDLRAFVIGVLALLDATADTKTISLTWGTKDHHWRTQPRVPAGHGILSGRWVSDLIGAIGDVPRARPARSSAAAGRGSQGRDWEYLPRDVILPYDDDGSFDRDAAMEGIREAYEGTFGGLTVKVDEVRFRPGQTVIDISIYDDDGNLVGGGERFLTDGTEDDEDGPGLNARHEILKLNPGVRGQGFATEYLEHLKAWYRAGGVERIHLFASLDVGGYAWARAGFDFRDQDAADSMITRLRSVIIPENESALRAVNRLLRDIRIEREGGRPRAPERIADDRYEITQTVPLIKKENVGDEAKLIALRDQLKRELIDARAILERTKGGLGSDDFPTPAEFVAIGRQPGMSPQTDTWLGLRLGMGSQWEAVLWL